MLLYLWLILTMFQDHTVCTLWISKPPTEAALIQSCGSANISAYRLDVKYNGQTVCTKPGQNLYTIAADCALAGRLDDYQIQVIKPAHEESICSVTTRENIEPTREEVNTQCPDAKKYTTITIKPWGTKKQEKLSLSCKPPVVVMPATIATSETYHLLTARLIWNGITKVDCPTGALISSTTPTPCALTAARADVLNWQNGLDAQILQAAQLYNVPPTLLKEIIARETQFWPWTGSSEEHGLIQITEDGADLVLRMSTPGYDRMSAAKKYNARIAWLRQLDCDRCTIQGAYDHAKQSMNLYAEALAAYWCTYGDWNAAITAWNKKHEGIAQ